MSSGARESIEPPRDRLARGMSRLYRHHLTTTTGGNLSIIDDDGILYITPSGGDKAVIDPKNVAYRYPGTEKFEGGKPSMEWPLHTRVYKARHDCKAVLHAHSLNLVSFSLYKERTEREGLACSENQPTMLFSYDSSNPDAGVPDTRCLIGSWNTCGRVAMCPYALPGSEELAEGVTSAVKAGADCVILQNHGMS